MTKRLNLGGHIGTADGLRHLVMNTRALDYTVVQTMLAGGRDYTPLEIPGKAANRLKEMLYGVELFVHLPYIINPCEAVPQKRGYYKTVFKNFCAAASAIGAKGVVIHPGFKKELTEEQALANLVQFFDTTYTEDWNLKILIETDSGSKNGSAIGSLEFIEEALVQLDSGAYGMVIDTTHLYARGVNLWDPEVRKSVLSKYGYRMQLVHLNSPDPDVTLGSCRDRHNTPFEDRPEWDHKSMIKDLIHLPLVLERRSLAVQEQDARYIRTLFGDEGATRGRYTRTDARTVEKRK